MGHARAYLTFDILRRILEDYFGYDVRPLRKFCWLDRIRDAPYSGRAHARLAGAVEFDLDFECGSVICGLAGLYSGLDSSFALVLLVRNR